MNDISVDAVSKCFKKLGAILSVEFELEHYAVATLINEECEDVLGISIGNSLENVEEEVEIEVPVESEEEEIEVQVESEVESEEESEEDSDTILDLSIEKINKMFEPIAKGGLKMQELKNKAIEMGLDIKGITRKDDLKNLMKGSLSKDLEKEEEKKEDVILIENSESSEVENLECAFILTKGPNAGKQCTTKPKNGEKFCGKHKNCRAVIEKVNSEESVDNDITENEPSEQSAPRDVGSEGRQPLTNCLYIAKRGAEKGKECTIKRKDGMSFCAKHSNTVQAKLFVSGGTESQSKDSNNTKCFYIGVRAPNKGVLCINIPKTGEAFCTKHANSQQALNYKANESPVAKKAAEQSIAEINSTKNPITRNKNLKVWVVNGGNLVVRTPQNPVVYAYVTRDGELQKKVTPAVRELAKELKLAVE